MPFAPEPPFTHGQPARTAVLFCNLGTPDAPTASTCHTSERAGRWEVTVQNVEHRLCIRL